MNLQEFTSPLPKPWLNIHANTVETKELDLVNQSSVPTPSVGKTAIYTDLSSVLSSKNSAGIVTTYISSDVSDNVLGLDNQAQSIAPYGQRDLWTYTSSTPAGTAQALHYSDAFSTLYIGGNGAASYSVNGGTTNLAVVFDVPPVGNVYLSSKAGLVIALTTTSQSYTSTDGINFVNGAATPTTALGFDMTYFSLAGLFIAPANVDASHKIITSPDGLVWTAQLSPDISINSIKSNALIVVAVGDVSPYVMWSIDGKIWTNTITPLVNPCRTVEYSIDQDIWCASEHGGANNTYYSNDGKSWIDTTFNGPSFSGPSLIWIGAPYYGWYASSSYQGNYSLYYTPDPRISTFRAVNLDGAVAGVIDYYLVYIASLDRLVLSTTTSPYIAFNITKRPYAIKSVSDDIRVRGAPVSVSQYSTYGDTTCNNTVAETNISTTASSLGTLVLQSPQPPGMVIKIYLSGLATSAAGDNLTIFYYGGATGTSLLFSNFLVIPALSAGLEIDLISRLTVRAATIHVTSENWLTPQVLVSNPDPTYNPNIGNTLRVTAQWGAAINQFLMKELIVEVDFRNGA